MKWFVIVFMLLGAYCYMLISLTNTAIDQTMQLHYTYQSADQQAELIAAGKQ